jgi:hypothetical protein
MGGSEPHGSRGAPSCAGLLAVPVVVLGAPAQAMAASCVYQVVIVNTLLAGSLSGFDMLVKDTKFDAVPSTTALFTVGTKMPVLQFLVTCNGQPATGVQVAVASDGRPISRASPCSSSCPRRSRPTS